MYGKIYGRKWLWTNLRCYPGIGLEGLRKTMKNLGLACLLAKFLTQDLLNVKQKC
jgi:hypothetical protein